MVAGHVEMAEAAGGLRHPDRVGRAAVLGRCAGQGLHLVLVCRRDPLLPLGSLRGRGQLTEVRAADLRFSEDEAAAFLESSSGLAFDPERVAALVRRTEGWIAGLHLAALSPRYREHPQAMVDESTGSDRYVVDYLMEEVITRLPEPVQEFLIATSILERLCPPLCRAVIGSERLDFVEERPTLDWLEGENLFVDSLDPEHRWFRYHTLFRELLRSRLRSNRSPEEIAELHRRAGVWLAGERQIDAALDHLLAAGDVAGASALVIDEIATCEGAEHWHDLERWVRRLPREAVEREPELLVAESWVFHLRWAWSDMGRNLDLAEPLLAGRPPSVAKDLLQSEIGALRTV